MSRYESLAKWEEGMDSGWVVVSVFQGSEQGPQSSSKGFIFVKNDGEETIIGAYKEKLQMDHRQLKVREEENGGVVEGYWNTAVYGVKAGTILKLFSMGTFMGQGGKRMGGLYVVADPAAPEIRAVGHAVASRNRAWIQGRLAPVPIKQFAALGIDCNPRWAHGYAPGVGAEIVVVAPARSTITGQARSGRRFSL